MIPREVIEAVANPLGQLVTTLLPMLITWGAKSMEVYSKLPQNFIEFLIGMFFCFFGGVYPALFAAVQAAENGGRAAVVSAIRDLADEAMIIIEASKKDDDVDKDKDGKKDVTGLSGKEYLARKTMLVLKKMNPDKACIIVQIFSMVTLSRTHLLTIISSLIFLASG